MKQQHEDLGKLDKLCAAITRKNGKGSLPSVRRDSPEWQAWRSWFKERGVPMNWSDKQPGDRMMTVAQDFPPANIAQALRELKE